jgi:hypothetical protein
MAPNPTFAFVGGLWCPTLDFVIAFWIMIYVSHIVNFVIWYFKKLNWILRMCKFCVNHWYILDDEKAMGLNFIENVLQFLFLWIRKGYTEFQHVHNTANPMLISDIILRKLRNFISFKVHCDFYFFGWGNNYPNEARVSILLSDRNHGMPVQKT